MSNMVVNTNVLSLNAHRSMKRVGSKQDRASAKLSSGERINTSADDASGLAISEKMRAQIRGLNKGSQNTQDGINLARVADGGLDQIDNILQRMRELTVQSANDTYTVSDRSKIQTEIDQLAEEIDSMSEKVQFNKIKVLVSKAKILEDNSITNSTTSSSNSTFSEITNQWCYKEPKGTLEYSNTTNDTYNSSSSSFTYTENEQWLGKVGDIADDYTPRLADGDWKDYYLNESVTTSTVNSVVDDQAKTETYEKVADYELSLAEVGANGMPNFAAGANYTTPTGTTFGFGTNVDGGGNPKTQALFRDNTTGTITSLYDTNSIQTISGNTITNVYDPINGVKITQTITMGADGYQVGFAFENVSGGNVDFDFKLTMDALHTPNADTVAGTLETDDVKVKISGDADNTYFGDVFDLTNTFDVTTTGGFNRNSASTMVWSNTLTNGQTATGVMDYDIEFKSDIYMLTTEVAHNIDTTTTSTVETMSQIRIPTQLAIQTGANAGEIMGIRLYDVDCLEMGLFYLDESGNKKSGVNVLSNKDCEQSLVALDRTIDKVSKYRADFGAKMNRMEHTIKANEISELNLTDSESKIRDTDMAKEMMELTKSNVLQSAAMNMLSQANQSTLNLLQILK